MTLKIPLSAEIERKLKDRAAAEGKDAVQIAREALEEKLNGPQTIDEILSPFRRQVAQSGMSDDKIDEFYEGLRDEAWRQRQGPKA
jgi:replication fork clamp-binding protein CrfC